MSENIAPSFLGGNVNQPESETRSSDSASNKMKFEVAQQLHEALKLAISEELGDDVARKLPLAVDVAAMTQNGNFRVLGYKSKDAFFKSFESVCKPYMLALERLGNTGKVAEIGEIAAEYQLSWKALQAFTKVEQDKDKLFDFIQTKAEAAATVPVRRLEAFLHKQKDPDWTPPAARKLGKAGDAGSSAPETLTWAVIAERVVVSFKRDISLLIEAPGESDFDLLTDEILDALDGAERAYHYILSNSPAAQESNIVPFEPYTGGPEAA